MHARLEGSTAISTVSSIAERFVRLFSGAAGAEDSALYMVGSAALGDLSPRQSNIDLVAVTAEPLGPGQLRRLVAGHPTLQLNGRDARVAYTTWEGLREAPVRSGGVSYLGRKPIDGDGLVNPMTWAILAGHPCPLHGSPSPVVCTDADSVRDWSSKRLPGLLDRAGMLIWRRHVARLVLESTRTAHGALTGEVVSLARAGELALPEASHAGHRVITDALGYREGASTSMYWGPFERKSNAVGLAQYWLRRVEAARS